jgi:hypothetical protein
VGAGVGAGGLGISVGVAVGVGVTGLGVGVLVGGSVGVGVAVAVQVAAGASWSVAGKGIVVGSGGTSWPQAVSRNTIATVHSSRLVNLALLTQHPLLLIAQSIDGVQARGS